MNQPVKSGMMETCLCLLNIMFHRITSETSAPLHVYNRLEFSFPNVIFHIHQSVWDWVALLLCIPANLNTIEILETKYYQEVLAIKSARIAVNLAGSNYILTAFLL